MTRQELYGKIYLLIRDIYGMCFTEKKEEIDSLYESAKYKIEYLYHYRKEKKGKESEREE